MKTHANQLDVPTDKIERRELIRWLYDHPIWDVPVPFGSGRASWREFLLEIQSVHVNPITDEIDEDDSLNTDFRVWIEAGPAYDLCETGSEPPDGGWTWENRIAGTHDIRLDCGAPTMEEALLELATLIHLYYDPCTGLNRFNAPVRCHAGTCTFEGPDFCVTCGFAKTCSASTSEGYE